MNGDGEATVIIPPLPPEESDRKYQAWKDALDHTLRPENIRRDHLCTGSGFVMRYLFRKDDH